LIVVSGGEGPFGGFGGGGRGCGGIIRGRRRVRRSDYCGFNDDGRPGHG